MAVDIDKFIQNTEKLIEKIAQASPDIIQTQALDAFALLRGRIVKNGEDADGKSLGSYSTKEIPSYFYKSSKKLKRDEFNETILEQNDFLSYKQWREANGLQTNHIDLTFTGTMFRGIGITNTAIQENKYTVEISGQNDQVKKEIGYNSDRYGDIMRISKAEDKLISEAYGDAIEEIIRQNGF